MSSTDRKRRERPKLSITWLRLIILAGIGLLLLPAGPHAQSGRRPVRPSTTSPVRTTSPEIPPRSKDASDDPPLSGNPAIVDTTPVQIDDDGTIRLDTSLVIIPVTVTDRQGRFITDLRRQDFRLYENEVEQQIDRLQSVDLPFNVVLMLDTSGSTRFRLEDIQAAAVAFVDQLRQDDRVMVVSFAQKHRVECEFTSDREVLRAAIYQTRTGGGTKLYEAVDFVTTELGKIEGRKAVVLFTDGVDTSSRRASARSTIAQVEESGAIFYPISYDTQDTLRQPSRRPSGFPGGLPPGTGWPFPGGGGRRRWPLQGFSAPQWPLPLPGGRGADYQGARQYLLDLAESSGGRLAEAGSLLSLSGAFRRIADELRQQYAISYYPNGGESLSGSAGSGAGSRAGSGAGNDKGWRRIRVRVNRPEAVVRARKGYRVPTAVAAN